MIHALRRNDAVRAEVGDVFSPPGTARLLNWLATPSGNGVNANGINRYLDEAHRMRPDLRLAFPDLAGVDGTRFIQWAWVHGRAELGLNPKLLPEGSGILSRVAGAVRRQRDRAIRFAGLIRWRLGEAASLVIRDLNPAAVLRRGERVRFASQWAWQNYRPRSYRGFLILIRSSEFRALPLLDLWYGINTAGIFEREVPCNHLSIMREPDVRGLATCIRKLVDQIAM